VRALEHDRFFSDDMSNYPRGRSQGQGQGRIHGRGGFYQGRGQGQQSSEPSIFAAGTPAKIDERLSDVDQLVSSLKNLRVTTRLPPRPGYGKLGKPVTLRANFFPIRIPKSSVYDYDVKTTPPSDGKLKARIFALLELHPDFTSYVRHIAHDKSNRLVSAKRLPQPLAIPIPYFDEGQSGPKQDAKLYTVTITLTQELDTGDLLQ
jgi:eukaryotic translation initiation factor 2C